MLKKDSPAFLLAISFVTGSAVMAIEISASRLLAPYFGTSLFVWANIIGVVLITLSAGYYIGGKLAERKPDINFLLRLVLLAGLLALSLPWLIRPLITSLTGLNLPATPPQTVFLSLLVCAVLLGIPLVLLGMVSPFLIKIYSLKSVKVGNIAGLVSATSTVGSILGTFLPALWMIPSFGTRKTIIVFAGLLVLLGLLGLRKKSLSLPLAAVFLGFVYYLLNFPYSAAPPKFGLELIYDTESAYQYIQVWQDSRGARHLIFDEGLGIQSVYDKDNILTGYYYDNYNLLPYLVKTDQTKKVLILGIAGNTIGRQYHYFWKDITDIKAVEVDPKVIDIAYRYFDLGETNVKAINGDARAFLDGTTETFDIIIADCFQNELYIPWTLTTVEFWEKVKAKLSPGGLVAMNALSPSADDRLIQAIENSQAKVFNYTYRSGAGGGWAENFMITSSQNPLAFELLPSLTENPRLLSVASPLSLQTERVSFSKDKLLLTDDRAPVEYLTDRMLLTSRQKKP